jgi:hypothetical protein
MVPPERTGRKAKHQKQRLTTRSPRYALDLSHKDASTEGMIGKSATACRAASIRMRQRATLGKMTNLGSKGIFTAASRKDELPLLCR